jgi:cytochrome c5
MNQLTTIAVAIALGCALAGCGKNQDNAGGASGSGAASGSSASTTPAGGATSGGTSSGGAAGATTGAGATGGPGGTSAAGAAAAGGPGAAGGTTVAAAGAGGGQGTYQTTCVACHGAGVAGAPKLGDKGDWGPRIAQGQPVLYQHALQGYTGKKGVMPPRGGNSTLADTEVQAAVDYMVSQAK